jgi:hypothetical protein
MAGGETIDPVSYYGKVISPESTVMQTRVRAISTVLRHCQLPSAAHDRCMKLMKDIRTLSSTQVVPALRSGPPKRLRR